MRRAGERWTMTAEALLPAPCLAPGTDFCLGGDALDPPAARQRGWESASRAGCGGVWNVFCLTIILFLSPFLGLSEFTMNLTTSSIFSVWKRPVNARDTKLPKTWQISCPGPVVLNLCVVTPSGVEQPFHRSRTSGISHIR